jgi:hypothetical protein
MRRFDRLWADHGDYAIRVIDGPLNFSQKCFTPIGHLVAVEPHRKAPSYELALEFVDKWLIVSPCVRNERVEHQYFATSWSWAGPHHCFCGDFLRAASNAELKERPLV